MFLLAACKQEDQPSASEKMYEHLEKAVELENQFVEQQQPKNSLEEKEEELFGQIIDLGSSEMDKIKELSTEAIDSIEQRKEILAKEKESIDQSKEEFNKVKDLLEDIEKEEVRAKADELVAAMEKRYAAFDNYYQAYSEALQLDEELYNMLSDEELEKENLDEQIEKANGSYDQILQYSTEFKEATDQYNQLKKEFYELSGMEVTYE
jgi:hypothetical protein